MQEHWVADALHLNYAASSPTFLLHIDFMMHTYALFILISWWLSDGEVNTQDCERTENDPSDRPEVAY